MAGSGVAKSPPMKMNIVRGTPSQLTAFLVLNIWTSHAGLPFLLAVVLLAKGVKRHPTFANLCIAFMIIGFASSLLVYGSATSGPEPPPVLCLLQASLLYGMPTFTSTAAFMLVWQMFLRVRVAYHCKPYDNENHVLRLWTMLAGPYIMYFIPVLITAGIGAGRPERVSRNRRFFYCSVESLPLTNGIALSSGIILLGTVSLIAWSIFILVRHRILVKPKGNQPPVNLDLSLPIRIMIFGLYLILAMSLSFLSVSSPSSPVPDLAIATAGSVVILIFGTQRDILRALCFWKRNRRRVIHIEPDIVTPDLRTAFDEVKKQAERR
ncbi:hypothetical protein D9611_002278 [Ephemerocybe angulata]|uniref:Uncharacterized protein n=1 Tax=Ephemerocybe angulata TaxID=980116 RepID=A0A8H5FEC8_9AGAR|nr:hypothetical protein D9611_002278 [Tulosesus angulatus]